MIPLGIYTQEDRERSEKAIQGFYRRPEDIRLILDGFRYRADWKEDYRIQSFRSALHSACITCLDAAILSYGLLELFFPHLKRRLLAIHRRDAQGEECGHCVTLYWNDTGLIGAFGKSSWEGLGHRDALYSDVFQVATTYAEAYRKLKIEPLYFGVTTLEEIADDLDWRFSAQAINSLSERLKEKYAYEFVQTKMPA